MNVVLRHLRHWRAAGLVSAEQEDALRRASHELAQSRTSGGVRAAVAILGGGLVLAGLILIIAENWGAIPRLVKPAAWGVLHVGFLAAAHGAERRFPGRPLLAEAFALLAGGWLLAGIALVSQIYHLAARPPDGLWFWAALVLPAAWVLKRRATAAVLFAALAAALTAELGTRDSWIHATRADGPWLWLAVPLLAGFAVAWLPRPVELLRGWLGAWTLAVSQVFLLVLGAVQELDRSDLGNAWAVAVAGLAAAFVFPARVLPATWDALTGRLVLGLSLLPWVLMGRQYDAGGLLDLTAVGLAWIVQIGVAVLVIRAAARAESHVFVNLGYLAVLAGVVTRYFDFFGNYLEGGLALTLTGALLLFVVYALERARRRTLARESA